MFLPYVDMDNVNAQSLNLREIAPRLDPGRFELTLLYTQEPDPRLASCPHIRLVRLPARLKTARILKEMFSGYDLIAYIDHSLASYLFLHSPRWIRRNTKATMHVEALTYLKNTSAFFRFLFSGTSAKCDFYTAITERVRKDFEHTMGQTVSHILPVGVDISFFSAQGHAVKKPVTVLFVGTLMESKRPLSVLDAAARFPQVQFRMIGADRHGYEQVVREKLAELGLTNVSLEGAKTQKAVAQVMQESDIFLLPSKTEGLPRVTLEGAASGLPCVVFCDYETPSVVDGCTGFQVATDEEMMDKLALLVEDTELRLKMGQAARKHAENFTWDSVAPLWEDVYRRIASVKRLDSTQQ